jgi:hypothetical protein
MLAVMDIFSSLTKEWLIRLMDVDKDGVSADHSLHISQRRMPLATADISEAATGLRTRLSSDQLLLVIWISVLSASRTFTYNLETWFCFHVTLGYRWLDQATQILRRHNTSRQFLPVFSSARLCSSPSLNSWLHQQVLNSLASRLKTAGNITCNRATPARHIPASSLCFFLQTNSLLSKLWDK